MKPFIQRIYLKKPKPGEYKDLYNNYGGGPVGRFIVEAVGDVKKDIVGNEFYELLLREEVYEPVQQPVPPIEEET